MDKTVTYKNRYGDVYTFQYDEDGNILWEGPFMYCRVGFPNDYTKAYDAYCNDLAENTTPINIQNFIKEVHRYDNERQGYTEIGKKYGSLVNPMTDTITMVDPSGGPYIARGHGGELISKTLFKGVVVDQFVQIDTGYKIIVTRNV